ncbi:hypothetical protein Achl_4016 (plasmid) [Pseudarthrobacter chlorophenolicus A6]|uniref:Uncharacterized protein n=1 Tax=Pseudarthrobacter chlorophenolicus (strain ATCC 700700 / DSM 12829 / CIP 107037 / JCM 12360 / KCTC 9906 / NCIMB 13794 / A6) TaxID=452863 RepID=B8HHS0_PSECP|nr:hypothetical protein [Pseudarthrobacter chlorophenolicus]ACL41967.1 hypothetical protein Achl_4016 [Pseudarthrobacter chlorophenolicus A6]SDQ19598.1 hypothetical protein SAMN04489738_0667 [Pseudarthrobacter chlorophenolicus]
MAAFNLDELLNDRDPITYSQGHPGAGTPQALFGQDHFTGPELAMFDKTYRGTDLYTTYSVGGWEAGNFHRVICKGPLVEGPHAWMSANATVLTAHKQERREQILVAEGDTLILRGTEYAISKDRSGCIKLTPTTVSAEA